MAVLQNAINANSITPLTTTQGGSGVSAPTAHGILISEGSSAFTPIVLSAGQILVGTTASDPSATTLTAGTGISITSVSGSITISSTESAGGGYVWNDIVTTTFNFVAGNAYIADNAAQVVGTLPATATVGDSFRIVGGVTGTSGWKIAQNASQLIHWGNTTTTTGTGGSITSGNQWDEIEFTCIVTNTTFIAYAAQGSSLSVV
jgi:hypothetical protein